MGDIIHALPVAHDIRQALPEAELHWVAEESFRDIPTLAPAVSKVHVTAFRRWRKAILSGPVRAEMADVKNALRAEHYDVVLDIQGLMRSAMVARWAGVPATGYSWGTAREPIASLAYARKLDLPASLGAVRRYRMAAAEALGYEIDPERPVFGLQANAEPSVKPAGPYAAPSIRAVTKSSGPRSTGRIWAASSPAQASEAFSSGAATSSASAWSVWSGPFPAPKWLRGPLWRRRPPRWPVPSASWASTRGLPISGRRSVVRASASSSPRRPRP